jgi:hypothetical protein
MATDLRIEFIDAVAVGDDWCVYERHGTCARISAVESHLGGCFAGHTDPLHGSTVPPPPGAEPLRLFRDGEEEKVSEGPWSYTVPSTSPLTFRRRKVEWRLFSGNRLLAARQVVLIPRPTRIAQLVFLAAAAPAVAWLAWLLVQLPSGDSASVIQAISLVLGTGIGGWMLSVRGLAISPKSPPLLWLGLPLIAALGLLSFQHLTMVVANATPNTLNVPSDGNQVVIPPGAERLLLAPRLLSSPADHDSLCIVSRGEPERVPTTPTQTTPSLPAPTEVCEPQKAVLPKALFGWLPRKTISCRRAKLFGGGSRPDAPCTSSSQQEDSTDMEAAFTRLAGKAQKRVARGTLTLRPSQVQKGKKLVKAVIHNLAEGVSMETESPLGAAHFVVPRRVNKDDEFEVLVPQIDGPVTFRIGVGETGTETVPLGVLRCSLPSSTADKSSSADKQVDVWLRPISGLLQRVTVIEGASWVSEWNVVARDRLTPAVFCMPTGSGHARTLQFELSTSFSHRPNDVVNLPEELDPIERVQIFVGGAWHGDIEFLTQAGNERSSADLSLKTFRVSGLKDALNVLAIGGLPIASGSDETTASASSIWKAEKSAPGDWAWALIPSQYGNGDIATSSKIQVSATDRTQRRYAPVAGELKDPAELVHGGLIQLAPEPGRTCKVQRNSDVEVKAGFCHRQDPHVPQDSEWMLQRGAKWALAGCDLSRLEICE